MKPKKAEIMQLIEQDLATEDIASFEGIEKLGELDLLSGAEQGFMMGYTGA